MLITELTPHRHHDTQLQHQSDQIQVVRYDVRFVASVVLVDGLDKDFRQMRWPRNTDIRLVLDIRMDAVEIMETRPLSKDKRWRVVEILEKAK